MDDQPTFAFFGRRTELDAQAKLSGDVLLKILKMGGGAGRSGFFGFVLGTLFDGAFEIAHGKALENDQIREPFLLESSIPGIFAAGDVRHFSVKRIASAVGEGAMAVQFVHQYRASL